MDTHIITAERKLAALLEAPASTLVGRQAMALQPSDLAPAINKSPQTYKERFTRVTKMRREQMLVPVNEHFEFASIEADEFDDVDINRVLEEIQNV